MLSDIQNIVSNSILLDTQTPYPDEKNPDKSFVHKLYSISEIGKNYYLVKLTVDELNSRSGDILRAYNVKNIEISPVAVSQVYKPAGTTEDMGADIASNFKVSQLYSIVKQYDNEFSAGKPVNEIFLNSDGTPKVFYHGTPNGIFTEFRDWQYFTDNKDYAGNYVHQGASSNGYKKTADNPKVYETYLTANKVFDTREPEALKIFNNEFFGKWGNGTPLSERGLPDWTDGDDLIEFFEENGYDYDAILLDEGGTGGFGDEVKSRGISRFMITKKRGVPCIS